jgi:hypothetical protein
MPAAVRQAIGRTIDATAGDDRDALRAAWADVVALVTPSLDVPSRQELRRLSASVQDGA